MDGEKCVGVIICKLDAHKDRLRGYIAMLAVSREYRKRAIGTTLVEMAVRAMKDRDADEVKEKDILHHERLLAMEKTQQKETTIDCP